MNSMLAWIVGGWEYGRGSISGISKEWMTDLRYGCYRLSYWYVPREWTVTFFRFLKREKESEWNLYPERFRPYIGEGEGIVAILIRQSSSVVRLWRWCKTVNIWITLLIFLISCFTFMRTSHIKAIMVVRLPLQLFQKHLLEFCGIVLFMVVLEIKSQLSICSVPSDREWWWCTQTWQGTTKGSCIIKRAIDKFDIEREREGSAKQRHTVIRRLG